MKRSVILSAIVVAGVGTIGIAALAQQGGPPGAGGPPRGNPMGNPWPISHVRDNVYKIFGAGGNTTVFVMANGVALVDTKVPGNGQAILDEVRKVTDKPVTMIINTHSHPDHTGSNTFFTDASPTIDVVAQDNSMARMTKGAPPTGGLKVTKHFGNTLTLGSGKDQIKLYYFGPAHTDGDAFVVFPAARTMVTGDVMAWSMAPLIDSTSGGSALGAADTLAKAVKGITGVDDVIEGHGYVDDWARFVEFAAFNRAIVDEAKKALAAGKQPKDAVAALDASGKWNKYLAHKTMPGLEYGGTGHSRAMINTIIAFDELQGKKPPLIMNMPDDATEPPPPRPAGPPPGAGGAPGGAPPAGGQRPGERG
jgi:glyoxylase-like metal-dependent hydrolase (beta-lactamase superfamily II)